MSVPAIISMRWSRWANQDKTDKEGWRLTFIGCNKISHESIVISGKQAASATVNEASGVRVSVECAKAQGGGDEEPNDTAMSFGHPLLPQ